MDKAELQQLILEELEQTEYDFHLLPHHGLIADWFVRYWDLWKLCYKYFHEEEPPYWPPDLTIRNKQSGQS